METNKDMKLERPLPLEIRPVDPEIVKELQQYFLDSDEGYVQVGSEKWFLPKKYTEFAEYFNNFKSHKDDVWICTFPRSGTTRTQEIVWLIANNFNYSEAKKIPLYYRSPFFERHLMLSNTLMQKFLDENNDDFIKMAIEEYIKNEIPDTDSPRFLKTHLAFPLLPPSIWENQAKIVYIARNPKDVALSYYNYNKFYRMDQNVGFVKFWDFFERNLVFWMPYWAHVKEAWSRRNESNILFLFYEDMNSDMPNALAKIAHFLNKPITEKQVERLVKHTKIENFRNNKSVNYDDLFDMGAFKESDGLRFIRSGKVGGWMDKFPKEINERADCWIAENLKDTDLVFPTY